MNSDLLRLLVCPDCRGDLDGLTAALVDGAVRCTICDAAYPVRNGIPILLPPGFDATHVHDEIDHAPGHKQQQAGYFDRSVAEEFEISRPHNTPEAYRWLLAQKFRRSVAHLPPLAGMTVADVCCGSGMDAEMLARAGARVLAFDISEGCASRAQTRAQRYGLHYVAVVADVEHLPLRRASADISYVHDGLHHLEDPSRGLREMMRVARRAVSVNEPASSLGTTIAVRMRLAVEREDAGNRVARLNLDDIARECEASGFDVNGGRYLMYYKHEPGGLMRAASRPASRALYRAAVTMADAALGRWGNKLQVTAVRRASATPARDHASLQEAA